MTTKDNLEADAKFLNRCEEEPRGQYIFMAKGRTVFLLTDMCFKRQR